MWLASVPESNFDEAFSQRQVVLDLPLARLALQTDRELATCAGAERIVKWTTLAWIQ